MSDLRHALRVAAPVVVAVVAGVLVWNRLGSDQEAGEASLVDRTRVRVEDALSRGRASAPELAPLESSVVVADAADLDRDRLQVRPRKCVQGNLDWNHCDGNLNKLKQNCTRTV